MITVTPSFNNEQKHRNFVSDVSFSSRTDKNKLALSDSTERIFNDGIDRIVTSPYGLSRRSNGFKKWIETNWVGNAAFGRTKIAVGKIIGLWWAS